MKIAFITIHTARSPKALPLGGASVAAYLLKNSSDYDVKVFDFTIDDEPDFMIKTLAGFEPDAAVFSVFVWNRVVSVELCGLLKEKYRSIVTIAGGPEVTADPESFISDGGFSPFDYIVAGEGEKVLGGILGRSALPGSPVIIRNDKFDEIDNYPSPYLTGVLDPANYDGVLWELSRGCPYKCAYCYEGLRSGKVRRINNERLIGELDLFAGRGVTQIFVLDPTFNIDTAKAVETLKLIKKRASEIHFSFEVRGELLNEEIVKHFASINCSLQIGLQSISPQTLQYSGRTFDKNKFRKGISLLNKYGIIFGIDIIYGLPGDTYNDFKETLDFALRLMPNNLDIFPLSVLPGTEIREKSASLNVEFDHSPPYNVTATGTMPAPDIKRAAVLTGKINDFYNCGRAVSFMGFVCRLLGMSPVDFISRFENVTGSIIEDQLLYIKKLLDKQNKSKFFQIIKDFILLNDGYNSILMDGPASEEMNVDGAVYILPKNLRFIATEYHSDITGALAAVPIERIVADNPRLPHFTVAGYRVGRIVFVDMPERDFDVLSRFYVEWGSAGRIAAGSVKNALKTGLKYKLFVRKTAL